MSDTRGNEVGERSLPPLYALLVFPIYVHHVPRVDDAARLSRLVAAAESVPRLRPVSGHIRDKVAEPGDGADAQTGTVTDRPEWARLDSNQGPTDYESAALTS